MLIPRVNHHFDVFDDAFDNDNFLDEGSADERDESADETFQYRNSRTGNRQTRTTQVDHDVFEGLPVRHWRKKPIRISTTPEKDAPNEAATMQNGYKELPLPRDFDMLPEHSQKLLRAARMGLLKRREAVEEDKENEENEAVNISDDTGFVATKWTLVPRELEGPEPEYLAKRRKGLPPLYTGATAPIVGGGQMRKTKIRKMNDDGKQSVLEVLVPEGQTVDGEIIEEETSPIQPLAPGTVVKGVGVVNAEGFVVAGEPIAPVPVRRRPPIPKKKKKHGPGRGRKKNVAPAPGKQQQQTVPGANSVDNGHGINGLDSASRTLENGEQMDGIDSVMQDAQQDDEEGSEEASEGEEGDEEDREEGELSPSPSAIQVAKPDTPVKERPEIPDEVSPQTIPPDRPSELSTALTAAVPGVEESLEKIEVEAKMYTPEATEELSLTLVHTDPVIEVAEQIDEEMLDEALPTSDEMYGMGESPTTEPPVSDIPATTTLAADFADGQLEASDPLALEPPATGASATDLPIAHSPAIEPPASDLPDTAPQTMSEETLGPAAQLPSPRTVERPTVPSPEQTHASASAPANGFTSSMIHSIPGLGMPMGPPTIDAPPQQPSHAMKDHEFISQPPVQDLPNVRSSPPIPQILTKFPEPPPSNHPPPPQRPSSPPPSRRPQPPPSLPSNKPRRPSGSTPEAPTPSPPTPIETTFDHSQQLNLSPKAPTMSPPTPIARDFSSSPETALASHQRQLPDPSPPSLNLPVQQPLPRPFIPGLQWSSPAPEDKISVQGAPHIPNPHYDAEIPHAHDPLDGLAAPQVPPNNRKLSPYKTPGPGFEIPGLSPQSQQRRLPPPILNADAARRVDDPKMDAEIPHQHNPLNGIQAPEVPPVERRLGQGEEGENDDLLGNLERSLGR